MNIIETLLINQVSKGSSIQYGLKVVQYNTGKKLYFCVFEFRNDMELFETRNADFSFLVW